MNNELRIALVQLDAQLMDKDYNIKKALYLAQTSKQADIICFPELFTTGYNLDLIGDRFYELAETIPGETTERMGRFAKEFQSAIIGSIVERHPLHEEILYNTAFIINKDGELIGKYRKYHLYPSEYKYFNPGTTASVFNINSVKIGISICYDHAFPELFRLLTLKGAQLIFILSAVPKGYEYLLNLRAKARAQDNQIFIAHVNRVGKEGEIEYCGLSKVVNPRGETLVEASETEEEVINVNINFLLNSQQKRQERILKSLRPELYEQLLHEFHSTTR